MTSREDLKDIMKNLRDKPPSPEWIKKALTTTPKDKAESRDFMDALFEDSRAALEVLSKT